MEQIFAAVAIAFVMNCIQDSQVQRAAEQRAAQIFRQVYQQTVPYQDRVMICAIRIHIALFLTEEQIKIDEDFETLVHPGIQIVEEIL